jgi:urease accessory protein
MNLRLLQLGDSALPVGGYTHSWGLEAALSRGLVSDAESLERWVRSWLRHAVGPLEGVAVAACCHAARAGDLEEVRRGNALLAASLTPPTIRAASRDMGDELMSLAGTWLWSADAVSRLPAAAWHHAAAFGFLAAVAGASPRDAALVYLHQAALGMIGAGVRAAPIGHTHGQQILAYLHPDVEELAECLAGRTLDEMGGGGPFYEVLCDEQSRLYSRLFRS